MLSSITNHVTTVVRTLNELKRFDGVLMWRANGSTTELRCVCKKNAPCCFHTSGERQKLIFNQTAIDRSIHIIRLCGIDSLMAADAKLFESLKSHGTSIKAGTRHSSEVDLIWVDDKADVNERMTARSRAVWTMVVPYWRWSGQFGDHFTRPYLCIDYTTSHATCATVQKSKSHVFEIWKKLFL